MGDSSSMVTTNKHAHLLANNLVVDTKEVDTTDVMDDALSLT